MYVVIGATGNTGNVVAKQLLARGQKVRAIGRTADRLLPLAKLGAEPFVADLADAGGLARALAGARAAYVMVPLDVRSDNVRAHSERVSDALASAIEKSRVKHAVALSSFGATADRRAERDLFTCCMENTLALIGMLHAMGKTGGPLRADVKLPMIATRDIGACATDLLLNVSVSKSGRANSSVSGYWI